LNLLSHGKIVTVLQYFTDKIDDYWHILYPIIPLEERNKDKYLYFYDTSRKATDYKGKFSSDGLYLFYGYDGKYHLHALELAQYALACWQAWRKTGENIWTEKALLHCNWLVSNQEKDGSWRIEHKNPKYKDLPSPWPSALAQGFAISALIRAFYYTNEISYLEVAKKACEFLEIDVKKNGVKREFIINDINGFIYEEYPRKNLSGVLNGYITSLLSIYELSNIDNSYKDIFSKNLENLYRILPLYDTGFWSYYSLDGNIASGFYHRLVTIQLNVLSQIDVKFNKYFNKFKSYERNKFFALKAFFKKINKVNKK